MYRRVAIVSIPFIAGQWSLRASSATFRASISLFQSPSLRGSGRFVHAGKTPGPAERVSIPFIAGQWSLHPQEVPWPMRVALVSIPFIAGQWSLLIRRAYGSEWKGVLFQSPSLRGSGRFSPGEVGSTSTGDFNPLHCGAVVASQGEKRRMGSFVLPFQSPSLRGSGRFESA